MATSTDARFNSGIRIAQVLGLTSTAFLCGETFSHSFSSTPALLKAPAPLLARQWKTLSASNKTFASVITLLSTSVFGFLAYREPKSSRTQLLYAASAALLFSCVPYSLLALEPIAHKLEVKADALTDASVEVAGVEVGVSSEESVHALVDRWAMLNLGRTVLSGLAAVLAMWAAVGEK